MAGTFFLSLAFGRVVGWERGKIFRARLLILIPESTELQLDSVFSGGRGQQSRVPALVSLSWLFCR